MIQKSKLIRVVLGRENEGVSPEQKANLAEAGLQMAVAMGIDTPIEALQTKK